MLTQWMSFVCVCKREREREREAVEVLTVPIAWAGGFEKPED